MPIPYHRLARTPAHRWWRTLLGTLFIAVGGAALAIAVMLTLTAAAALAGRPENADGLPGFGDRGDLALTFLMVAALLPVTLLAARWIQRRPAGTLSSVTGRLRRRWLLTCLPVAFAAVTVFLVAGLGLGAVTGLDAGLGGAFAGWGPFAASLLVLLLVVPVQAAAEEYVTRGWLLQAVGTWFRSPWVPIALQAVVFAALHGWGTTWGFADLLAFGVVAGWLTVRTGGLEAAIALHVVNNLISGGLGAFFGDLGTDETAADLPWQLAVADLPVLLAYAAVILHLARRRGLAAGQATAVRSALPVSSSGPVSGSEAAPSAAQPSRTTARSSSSDMVLPHG
jgi:uncharacterized protein